MRIACIDIGTNSALAMVAEKAQGKWNILYDDMEIIRLGEGMKADTNAACFLPEALKRCEDCVQTFVKQIKTFEPEKIYAFATAAARKAKNSQELINIFMQQDLNLEIISGAKEAELTFKGAKFNLDIDPYIVLDIGGGSTEIMWQGKTSLEGLSLNVGAVVLKESFFLKDTYSEEEIKAAREYIHSELIKLPKLEIDFPIFAVAGTPTTLVACNKSLAKYDSKQIHGAKLDLETTTYWLKNFNVNLEERKKIVGLNPKRADIIFAGTLILQEVLKFFRRKSCIVSIGGLRYGVLD